MMLKDSWWGNTKKTPSFGLDNNIFNTINFPAPHMNTAPYN